MRPIRDLVSLMRALKWAIGQPEVRALLTLTLTMIAIATAFYCWMEGWDVVDSLYFSVVTIATVGYGDLVPTTVAAKIFTVVYVICGIGLFATTAGALARQALQRTLQG